MMHDSSSLQQVVVMCSPSLCFLCAGYEKLKMYGFYIHACIDGGSNFAPYAIVALDKTASTLFNAYHEATAAFEHPLRLRADMCFEAVRIGQDMIDVRGPGAYLTGPSTANQVSFHRATSLHRVELCIIALGAQYNLIMFLQRIERFWNNVWSHVASYFKGLFQYMERCGVLNR